MLIKADGDEVNVAQYIFNLVEKIRFFWDSDD